MSTRKIAVFWMAAVVCVLFAGVVFAQTGVNKAGSRPLIWRDPGNIAARDLYYGPGSAERVPAPPFRFLDEDKDGESPKFNVMDSNDVKWSVKLGREAQAETVATRIVWAMGYFVEESYYLPRAQIEGLPRLSRGTEFVEHANIVRGARFEPRREGVTRGPNWDWLKNPFVGTREFNGLKTLMVLLANYDTSPANNRVVTYETRDGRPAEVRFVVTDLGATFGKVGGLGGHRSKNDLDDYRSTRLVKRMRAGYTEFQYRTRPSGLGYLTFVFHPGYWRSQTAKEKAMRRIPTVHVRWIAARLARLSDRQLSDAFEAAGYDPTTKRGFITALRDRIDELTGAERVAGVRRAAAVRL
jgi:hypothetical protein